MMVLMNDSTIDSRDLAVLKVLLDEKVNKLEDILRNEALVGGARDYYETRVTELREMQVRLRGR